MQVVCPTIARAVAHLEKDCSAIAEALIKILKEHADDEYEIDMFYENSDLVKMVFKSVHDVETEVDLGDVVIFVSTEDTETTANVRSVTGFVQDVAGETVYLDGKPIKEFGQKSSPNTDSESNPSNSSTESKTMNTEQTTAQASSTQQTTAPQQPAQTAAPADNNELALKIGKGVLYVAGAGAAIAAGVWAWKKWGSSTTSSTTV